MNFLALLVQMAGGEQSKAHMKLLQVVHLRLDLITFGQAAHGREHFSGRDFDAIFRTPHSPSGWIACHAAGPMA